MNILTYRKPTHVYRSDACEHGLGGFSYKGRAWRWKIPTHLLGRAHINLLEFMGSIICIWLDSIEGTIEPESCLLAMGDSTTSTGWLKKSNFIERDEEDTDTTAKLLAARHLAHIVQRVKSCLYSQWFPGEDNLVADCLSRDIHLTDSQLLFLLTSHIPSQLPPNFSIVPLPSVIESWACSLLAKMPVRKQRQVRHKMSEIAAGDDGASFSTKSASTTTPISSLSTNPGPEPSSSPLLPKPCAKPATLQAVTLPWLKAQSVPPLTTWHRPSGQITGLIHDKMTEDDCRMFYNNSTEATKTKTPTSCNKKHSPSPSSANFTLKDPP